MADSKRKLWPVILCGGSGTRLWPLSRADSPKQFISLSGTRNLLEETMERVRALGSERPPILIAAAGQRDRIRGILDRAGFTARLLLEPMARNTAPALAAAAFVAAAEDPDAVLVMMPADHVIEDNAAFSEAVARAAAAAAAHDIAVLGVRPREPSGNFGYIVPVADAGASIRKVERFTEKPDRATALELMAKGALWNAGLVVARAQAVLESLQRHEPGIFAAVKRAVEEGEVLDDDLRLEASAFASAPAISFDYAVLERHHDVVLAALDAGWRDVGNWPEVGDMLPADAGENRVKGDVHLVDCRGNLIFGSGRLVVGLGLEDLIVVDTPDALLVARRDHIGRLGDTAKTMLTGGRREARDHPPFATGRLVLDGERGQCGEAVNSCARHLVVLSGRVIVEVDGAARELGENESVFVGPGQSWQAASATGERAEMIDLRLTGGPSA